MKKLYNSSFELIDDIIKTIKFDDIESKQDRMTKIQNSWSSVSGSELSKLSRVYDILNDDTLLVICKDSFVANELYFRKSSVLNKLNEELKVQGINIKDIKFDYRKWDEKENE